MINVLLVSCDTAVRSVLARLLEAEPDLTVHELLPFGQEPDVVVLRLRHAEQAQEARRRYPRAHLIGHVSALRPDLRDTDVDALVDSVAPYEQLLATIRRLGPQKQYS